MSNMMTQAGADKCFLGSFLSEIAAPNIIRIYHACGLDFVIVDCEHGAFDYSQVAALAAVGNGVKLPIFVRIPCVSREPIQKYLDAGVDGLVIPMMESAEMAQEAISFTKYAPMGRRGASTMRPHSEYNPGKLADYMARANRRTMVLAQIETKEGLRNASKIVGTKGLDGLFIGPNDLSIDFGNPGEFHTPEMESAVRTIISVSREAGKLSGVISSDMAYLKWCRSEGMRLFSCNSEVGLLVQRVKSMMDEFVL